MAARNEPAPESLVFTTIRDRGAPVTEVNSETLLLIGVGSNSIPITVAVLESCATRVGRTVTCRLVATPEGSVPISQPTEMLPELVPPPVAEPNCAGLGRI